MPATTSRLRAALNAEVAAGGVNWSPLEAALEVIASELNTISTDIVDAINTANMATLSAYRAAAASVTIAGTPTDVFTITGSATKTVRVRRIAITGTCTSTSATHILLIKRSTANSGGTSTATTAVPLVSTSPAATATVLAYTANPASLGAIVGNVDARRGVFPTTSTAQSFNVIELYSDERFHPITLIGTGEVLAVNFGSVSLTGGTASCMFEWTEE